MRQRNREARIATTPSSSAYAKNAGKFQRKASLLNVASQFGKAWIDASWLYCKHALPGLLELSTAAGFRLVSVPKAFVQCDVVNREQS